MRATDVAPNRLDAAEEAAKRFAGNGTPGANLGVIAFAGNVNVLVHPLRPFVDTADEFGVAVGKRHVDIDIRRRDEAGKRAREELASRIDAHQISGAPIRSMSPK